MAFQDKMVSRINWKPTSRIYDVSNHKTLLHSLMEKGLELEFECLFGHCQKCLVRLINGDVCHEDVPGLTEEERKSGLILLCSCRPKSETITLDLVKPDTR
jgi:ferredoxin